VDETRCARGDTHDRCDVPQLMRRSLLLLAVVVLACCGGLGPGQTLPPAAALAAVFRLRPASWPVYPRFPERSYWTRPLVEAPMRAGEPHPPADAL